MWTAATKKIAVLLGSLAERVASKSEGRLLLKQGEQFLSNVEDYILWYADSGLPNDCPVPWPIATPLATALNMFTAGVTRVFGQILESNDVVNFIHTKQAQIHMATHRAVRDTDHQEDAPKSYIETVLLWWPITMITKIGRFAGLGLSPIHTEESNQSEPLPDDEREPPSEETETQPPSENKDSDTSFTTVASDTKPNDTSDHDDFHSTSSLRATDSPTEIDPLPCSQATDGEAIISQTIETIEDVSTLATVVPSVVVPSFENAIEQKKPKKGGFASLFKKKDRNS